MGEIPLACEGNWLVENKESKKPQVLIAREIVAPQNGLVPLRVLNLESQPITVFKGTRVAKAEAIDPTREISTVGRQSNTRGGLENPDRTGPGQLLQVSQFTQ